MKYFQMNLRFNNCRKVLLCDYYYVVKKFTLVIMKRHIATKVLTKIVESFNTCTIAKSFHLFVSIVALCLVLGRDTFPLSIDINIIFQ